MDKCPNNAGLPDGISRLLTVLNGVRYRDVTWTLGHSFKGFYLNSQWPKHVKFPAKIMVMDRQAQAVNLDL